MSESDGSAVGWAQFLSSIPDGALLIDATGHIHLANEAFADYSGYSTAELEGLSVECLVPERVSAAHALTRERFADGVQRRPSGRHSHLSLVTKDGAERDADIALSQLDLDGEPMTLAIVRDLDDLHRTSLHGDSELRYRLAFDISVAPIVFTDDRDRILAANDAFCDLLGRTRDELLGQDSTSFTYPLDLGLTEASLERVRRHEVDAEHYVKRYVHRDGRVLVVEVARRAAYDASGHLLFNVISERDVTEERSLTAQLAHQALHDPLTGLANRALLEDRLARARAKVTRQGGFGAILMVDLDDFKDVNDSHGHLVGDQVLIAVARRLEEVARTADTLCRFGGDEFVYLVEGVHQAEQVRRIAERLLGSLEKPFAVMGLSVEQHASIGVAIWDIESPDDLAVLEQADLALYEAKRLGRNRYTVFSPSLDQSHSGRGHDLQALRDALSDGSLSMHFQPIVSAQTTTAVGFEALMRWQHHERGWIAPSEFLGLAEPTDLIGELGAFALREATRAAASWSPALDGPYVTVNLSARQLFDPELTGHVRAALAASGLAHHRLVVEIPERVALEDAARTSLVVTELRDLGVGCALDGFGDGLASLAQLLHLDLRFVKIDRSLVRPPTDANLHDALVDVIVTLGHRTGIDVVAQGVETPEDLDRLRQAGCDLSQGFLFSQAVPLSEVNPLMGTPLGLADAKVNPSSMSAIQASTTSAS